MTAPILLPVDSFRWVTSWRTDVQQSFDGSEVRVSTASLPRAAFAGSFMLADADIRSIDQILSAGPAGTFELPLVHEATPVLAAVTSTTLSVSPTLCDWIAVGRRVLIVGPGSSFRDTITAVGGGGGVLTITGPSSGSYPVGPTHVYPLEDVRLEDGQQTSRWAVNAGRWDFRGRQATVRDIGGAGATLTTYDGFTVLDRRPLMDGATVGMQSIGGVRFVDAGASFTSLTSLNRSQHRRAGMWHIDTAADRQWWKAFGAAVRGKRHAFLRPTWYPDMTLYEQPDPNNYIRVVENYTADWYPSLAHRRLQIEYADGSVDYFAIGAVTTGSGYYELSLSDDLRDPIPGGSVRTVSFLETVRLDSDDLAIDYSSAWRGRVALTTATVQEFDPTDTGATYDEDDDLGGDPIDLYAIATPGTTYYLTSDSQSHTYDGHAYTPSAISRGELPSDGSSDPEALVVRLPGTHAVSIAYGFGNPYRSIALTLTRLQTGLDAEVAWSGPIPNIAPDGDFTELRCPSLLADRMQADAPQVACQRQCNNRVGDARCRVDMTTFRTASAVSAISSDGYTVTVSTVGGHVDGFFARGKITRDSDSESRMIISQVGAVLTLQAPFRTLATANAITLEAGCDGFIETCRDKFANVDNHTGHPFVPATRLFLNNLHLWRG